MSKQNATAVSRRKFFGAVCPVVAGGLAVPRSLLHAQQQSQAGFWSQFTAEEQAVINSSSMALDVPNYMGQGLGCAEICLAASCEYMGVTDEWVDAAAVFSGGFGKGDLCGLLTGGLMAMGIAAGKLHQGRAELKQFARGLKDEYWDWWTSRGPVHCSELQQRYDGSEQFMRMMQRAAAKVEELIEPARA
ncbi:MAG: C_GCAxxG_C_C family protein [Gemmatimonadota bacterium]|nr:MAG: C_GCAxxG_C_C family protein [Gemmatimonadota bacterium]